MYIYQVHIDVNTEVTDISKNLEHIYSISKLQVVNFSKNVNLKGYISATEISVLRIFTYIHYIYLLK